MTLFESDPSVPEPAAQRSPTCALCGLKARMWSGVEGWLVNGLWIGWCSKECQRQWINGGRRDPDSHLHIVYPHRPDVSQSAGASE